MTRGLLFKLPQCLFLVGILLTAAGCATTQKSAAVDDNDPLEPANRVFFNVTDTLDKHLLKPIAESYVEVTPLPVRVSITNFFDNLGYLNVILNDFLQGKFNQGLTDILRFTYNSTFGIAGLFDVATPIGMPANNEDFGQTLATWGVDKGAYLYLPFMGPDTVRDTTDRVPRALLNPFFYLSNIVMLPINALSLINTRAGLLEATSLLDEVALDPYSFTREAFLQQRESLIYDGNPPDTDFDAIFGDIGDTDTDSDEAGMLLIE